MSQATVAVAISWGTDPASTPSWTDITNRVLAFSIRRGRPHEREPFQAGSLTLQLDDPNRDFDPLNTSGAYYPNVRTLRRVRLQATWNSITYDLFHGYITTLSESYPARFPKEARCTIQASDGFAVLALAKLNTSLAQQTTAARFTSVLDAIGWPAGDRSLHTAQQSVQPATLVDAPALTHLQQTIDSENGFFFVSKGNVVTGFNRDARRKRPITNYLTWGDGGGAQELYADLRYSFPGDRIVNSATVTIAGGQNEVQTITITGSPTGGSFTLSWGGFTTSSLPWNATAAQVQAALEVLGSIQPGNVAVSGGPGPQSPWLVTFQNALGGQDVATITAVASFTGGSSPAIGIATSTYYAAQASASDATSQARYYPRSASVSGSPAISASNAARVAGFLVGRYKEPLGWFEMDIDPVTTAQWREMLARELNDLITVAKTNVPAGAAISQDCFIDQISLDFGAEGGIWRATWGLTPIDPATYWQVEDSTYGILDSTTRLGY